MHYWKQNQGAKIYFCLLFLFFPFSISHSKVEIFVKDFSWTTWPRILKFGTNIRYDRLYCVLNNQPHMAYQAYQSLYLSFFLSFQQFFHLISSASSNFVYTMRTTKWITGNKTKVLRLNFVFFFYVFLFPSLRLQGNAYGNFRQRFLQNYFT